MAAVVSSSALSVDTQSTVLTVVPIILLSSFTNVGQIVTIQDGSITPNRAVFPIVVSTVSTFSFFDGSHSTLIRQQGGQVSVVYRGNEQWQLLNNTGYQTGLSNAYLQTLTAHAAFIGKTDGFQEFVSTAQTNNITVLSNIFIEGGAEILGALTVGGSLTIFSTLQVLQNLNLGASMSVGQEAVFGSAVHFRSTLTVQGLISTPNDLIVGENLYVSSGFIAGRALVPTQLRVQTLQVSSFTDQGGLQTSADISTFSSFFLTDGLVASGAGLIKGFVDVVGQVAVGSTLHVTGPVKTNTLTSISSFYTGSSLNVRYSMDIQNLLSSLSDIHVSAITDVQGLAVAEGNGFLQGSTVVETVFVGGNAQTSTTFVRLPAVFESNVYVAGTTIQFFDLLQFQESLAVGDTLYGSTVRADTGISSFQNLQVQEFFRTDGLDVGGSTSIGQSLFVESTLTVGQAVSTFAMKTVGDLTVEGTLVGKGLLSTGFLQSPSSFTVEALYLQSLSIQSYGSIPRFLTETQPAKLFVGTRTDIGGDLTVGGSTDIVGSLSHYAEGPMLSTTFLLTSTVVSSLYLSSVLSSMLIGLPVSSLTTSQRGVLAFQTNPLAPFQYTQAGTSWQASGAVLPQGTLTKILQSTNFLWVASAESLTTSTQTLQWSYDGYTWNEAQSGGFYGISNATPTYLARSIATNGFRFVGVGYADPPITSILYSDDGMNWNNCFGSVFSTGLPNGLGGYDVVYSSRFQRFVAVGADSLGGMGIRWSSNGINWSNATSVFPFNGFCIGENSLQFLAFGQSTIADDPNKTQVLTSPTGLVWQYIALDLPTRIRRVAFGNGLWVAVGSTITGNPITDSIQYSSDAGASWNSATTGGLNAFDVLYDSNLSKWFAIGESNGFPSVQTSSDGANWSPTPFGTVPAIGTAIAQGQFTTTTNNLTVSLSGRVETLVSSAAIIANSIRAESFRADMLEGEGSGLSNIKEFNPILTTSSLTTEILYTKQLVVEDHVSKTTNVQTTTILSTNVFLSSLSLYLAAGANSEPTGTIQIAETASEWTTNTQSSFQLYGTGIAGNSNATGPLFVATGADRRGPKQTIQYSLNGTVWSAISTGGFSNSSNGQYIANSVAYNSLQNVWVATGYDNVGSNTIQRSVDGSNWFDVPGGFERQTLQIKAGGTEFVALGLSSPVGGVFSGDGGITWSSIGVLPSSPTAIGYGTIGGIGNPIEGWLYTRKDSATTSKVFASYSNAYSFSTLGIIPGLVRDIVYGNNYWVAVGGQNFFYSFDGFNWQTGTPTLNSSVDLVSVAYNQNQKIWVAGAQCLNPLSTIWTSQTSGTSWQSITSGGFSSIVQETGVGYSVFWQENISSITGLASTFLLTTGRGTLENSITADLVPEILGIRYTETRGNYSTVSLYSDSNLFLSNVRGIAVASNEPYTMVAVGDAFQPQRTIARATTIASPSQPTPTWLPAVVGGFSTTGYGVVYYVSSYFAVGESETVEATIQYSPDGASWFPVGNSNGFRQGGRGIAVGLGALSNTLVAVGKDGNAVRTLLWSSNGTGWATSSNNGFSVQGNGVAAGFQGATPIFMAVGQDANPSRSIATSANGYSWTFVSALGFTNGANGVGYAKIGASDVFVVVGNNANSNLNIQVSQNGGTSWSAVPGFTGPVYGVTYASSLNTWFAVGQDINGTAEATIKTARGIPTVGWSTLTEGGFGSQIVLGEASALFTQQIQQDETFPYITFPKLVVYERNEPRPYPVATLRVLSTLLTFNEALAVNTSTQVIVNSNAPSSLAALTVNGTIYVSSLYFSTASVSTPYDKLAVSSVLASTVLTSNVFIADSIITSTLAIYTNTSAQPDISRATSIYGEYTSLRKTGINQLLWVMSDNPGIAQTSTPYGTINMVGVQNRNPALPFDVNGTFATSSLSSGSLESQIPIYTGLTVNEPLVFWKGQEFSAYKGSTPVLTNTCNRIYTETSSMTINSALKLEWDRQQMGVYTTNPRFTLDVQTRSYLETVSTPFVQTRGLFFTLQSV
jgi:predicted acyltransferase (DUF342 family)